MKEIKKPIKVLVVRELTAEETAQVCGAQIVIRSVSSTPV